MNGLIEYRLSQHINDISFSTKLIEEIYDFLSPLKKQYRNFEQWYYEKVVSEISKGLREVIVLCRYRKIIGVSILKNTEEEKKICTIYIAPIYQQKGLGRKLFLVSFDWLETNRPLITVPKEIVSQFEPLFRSFEFELTEIRKDNTSCFSEEYVYNGKKILV